MSSKKIKVKKLYIPIVLGTVREGRGSEAVAKYLLKRANARPEIQAVLFDPKDFNWPKMGYGRAINKKFPKYVSAVKKADGFIWVVPEYNHGYPGDFKKVVDLMLPEYIHKAVGFAGVSAGGFGATRVIEQLVTISRELGLTATFSDLNISNVREVFDVNGKPANLKFDQRIEMFLDELIWLSLTLRWGREHFKSKYHKCPPWCTHLEFK